MNHIFISLFFWYVILTASSCIIIITHKYSSLQTKTKLKISTKITGTDLSVYREISIINWLILKKWKLNI